MPRIFDVLQYDETDTSYLATRVPQTGAADIRMGSQLIVREGQAACFYRDGKALDVFGAGRHTLTTGNIPILTGLLAGLLTSGNTPFTAEVFFLSLRPHRDLKWGTAEPIVFRDSELDMVRLRAFGNYSMVIDDASLFVGKVAAARGYVTIDDMQGILRASIVSRFIDTIGETITTVLDLPRYYDEIAAALKSRIAADFAKYGLKVTDFFVQAITPPPEVQKLMDERSGMGAVGDMGRYREFKTSQAIGDAATSGSGMGEGMGMGMGAGIGMAMAGQMAQGMSGGGGQPTAGIACPECGTVNAQGAKFCSNCGANMTPKTIPCPKCKTANLEGAKFCSSCGSPMVAESVVCPKCKTENPVGSKFCSDCGSDLG